MKISSKLSKRAGMTLAEMMVGMGVGALMLTVVAQLYIYGLRSFTSLGNYADLDGRSRMALDTMSREIREASAVLSLQTNAPLTTLTLTNAMKGTLLKYTWDSSNGSLITEQTGQPTRTNLVGCDIWNVNLFQRTPGLNGTFYPTSNPDLCKLVNMSWKCSRTVLGSKLNTETVLTAQVVLRNKR